MIYATRILAAGLVFFTIVACQTVPDSTTIVQVDEIDIRQAMIEGVNPAALAIWDVGNNATDDEGNPDPSKLDPAALARLREGAQMLETDSKFLAVAEHLRASGPDLVGGRVPEGVASREQIQAAIDADPAGFRAYSRAMGGQAEMIRAAIEGGDRNAVADRVRSFDGACQACHENYWYVTQ
jgi:cytochrome c556